MKRPQNARYSLLHPLELVYTPWQSISIDFIVELLLSKGYAQIWVVVDYFIKLTHFILIKDNVKKAPDLA
jgi:hypothetical protein